MTISDLTFKPEHGSATFSEVVECANILQGMYSKENHYRWIQPSEAFSHEGSISTVLKGIRPFAFVDLPESSAYLAALKTISGITVVRSPYKTMTYHIYRTGAAHLSQFCATVDKMVEERLAKEGFSNIKALERVLASHKQYGKILYYAPEAIASFEARIQQMLKDELSKTEEPGKEQEKTSEKPQEKT